MGLHWNGASTLDREDGEDHEDHEDREDGEEREDCEDREGLEKMAALGGFRRNWSLSRGPGQNLVDLQPSQVLLELRMTPTSAGAQR